MLLREKGKPDGPTVGMGWDEAQAALQAGTHEVAESGRASGGEAGPGEETDASLALEGEADAQTKADLAAALRRG
ncbi:hypothetical protein [Methylorubrum sp. POS3]|uniref:hypothetical protein n=1 Tax=Methylorubrum sp. POS3 TaxID=2998492 RepID=UPI00372A7A89